MKLSIDAVSSSALVWLNGDYGAGKTAAAKHWCAAQPGKARYVAVPPGNTDAEWFGAIGKALGYPPSTNLREMTAKIEYALNWSGLCLVFDGADWLVPQRYSRTTPPSRLNWIRSAIVNKGLPCAVIGTPASLSHVLGKYLAKTGFKIDDLLGHIAFTEELPRVQIADALKVAEHLAPQFNEDLARSIAIAAVKAKKAAYGLHGVVRICERAAYILEKGFIGSEIDAVQQAINEAERDWYQDDHPVLHARKEVEKRIRSEALQELGRKLKRDALNGDMEEWNEDASGAI